LYDLFPQWTALAVIDVVIIVTFIPWVLMTKKESTSAIAWCLVVFLMPILGAFLFWVFGFNAIVRPLRRKRRHRSGYRKAHPPPTEEARRGESGEMPRHSRGLAELALRLDAFPVTHGNRVVLFADTQQAYEDLLAVVGAARSHVHLEFFIFRSDPTGQRLLELLTRKAREGVQVRLLYDSMGSRKLSGRALRPLQEAGGKVAPFLPLNPLRSRFQVNLRNHRKIVVIDGRVGYTGGMNIGDEYLGKSAYFGYWRDEFLRVEGPAVSGLQRVFTEDWDFAVQEPLTGDSYFPKPERPGEAVAQVIESGPDQEVNAIREVYFAAILCADKRLWIASPYFVPDAALGDALRLARFRGVDVRLVTLQRPDHYVSFYAGRYYFADVMAVGMKIYQYGRGMMHSKMVLIDDDWALVGSPNLDNRSLHLNFEAACLFYSPEEVAAVERRFEELLKDSTEVEPEAFGRRPFLTRLTENACRLFSPIL
jgi:cardiolipin synthase